MKPSAIKAIIIALLAIVGVVVGFAIDPTTIPISVLWAIFIATMFVASIVILLRIEAILK